MQPKPLEIRMTVILKEPPVKNFKHLIQTDTQFSVPYN